MKAYNKEFANEVKDGSSNRNSFRVWKRSGSVRSNSSSVSNGSGNGERSSIFMAVGVAGDRLDDCHRDFPPYSETHSVIRVAVPDHLDVFVHLVYFFHSDLSIFLDLFVFSIPARKAVVLAKDLGTAMNSVQV